MDEAAHELHHQLQELVRLIGHLHPEQTEQAPAGRPIPLSQVFALHELDRNAPLSQVELAHRLGLEKSTVSRLVADMERGGLLVRQRDPKNRRSYRLLLSRRGRAAHARLGTGYRRRAERLVSGMTAAERQALMTALPALLRVLQEEWDRK